jgi:hypothetical protein
MNSAYKIKNYNHAASFAKRLLDLNPSSAEVVTGARKVLKFAEQNPRNENNINYDERNPFVVCSHSHMPIYRGSPLSRCPYCLSSFKPEFAGKLCDVCQIAKIGQEAPGLTVILESKEKLGDYNYFIYFYLFLFILFIRCLLAGKKTLIAYCNCYYIKKLNTCLI